MECNLRLIKLLSGPTGKMHILKEQLEQMIIEAESEQDLLSFPDLKEIGKSLYSEMITCQMKVVLNQRQIVAAGGRGNGGQSLSSVEGYSSDQQKWLDLPAMNTERSFASCVVCGKKVFLSGGDTGSAITDIIEFFNLGEILPQWKTFPARLPVPLSAHQTVVHEGKLIVIGGHDGNEGKNSSTIYEMSLEEPYTTRILGNLVTPVAWHRAEIVGGKIFIFGGERSPGCATSAVFVYNLDEGTFHEMRALPHAMAGMATVTRGQSVVVVGGVGDNEQKLSAVFTYDTLSGEHHSLPQMNEISGPCSAVIGVTLDTSASCPSDTYSDTLVVLGCPSSPNTVEGYNFDTHTWRAMAPTRVARKFCSVVAVPVESEIQ